MDTQKTRAAAIPVEIDRAAPVIVRLERLIAAPLESLWALHIDIARWPAWQKDILTASLDGPLLAGTSFTWTTAGLDTPIVSTVYAIDPHRSTLWGGPSAGLVGVHRWMFEANATGTHVVTEESWAGTAVEANPAQASALLTASLERWLDFLTAAATA